METWFETLINFGPEDTDLRDKTQNLYNGRAEPTVQYVKALEVEREYLYWTNHKVDANVKNSGAIHKAFTEPFIVAAPFRTYEV